MENEDNKKKIRNPHKISPLTGSVIPSSIITLKYNLKISLDSLSNELREE